VTPGDGVIVGASVAHGTAAVEDLEAAAVHSQRETVREFVAAPGIDEAYVLRTCNRVEGYVVAPTAERGRALLADQFEGVDEAASDWLDHEESLRHLLAVAAGLESVVLGEDQILGQVRDAYEDARSVGGLGPILEDAVTKAIHVGERARTETAINDGAVSLASAAVSLAADEVDIDGETARDTAAEGHAAGLVIGAGEMGTLAAKALAGELDRVIVANRTIPHATHVAEAVDGEATAIGLDAIPATVAEARVVVAATDSPEPVVDADAFADAGETIVVDIAQPRDVPEAAEDLDHVTLRDLDDLEAITERTRAERRDAAVAVEAMVEEELDRLLASYKRKRADRVISAMYESAERVKAEELQTAFGKADFDDEERQVVEAMADAIVSQLLAAPTESLRDAAEADDWSTIHTALQLFDPNFGPGTGDGPPGFVDGASVEGIPEGVREELPAGMLEQLDD
jgi:glutamyl-tRNA reductase